MQSVPIAIDDISTPYLHRSQALLRLDVVLSSNNSSFCPPASVLNGSHILSPQRPSFRDQVQDARATFTGSRSARQPQAFLSPPVLPSHFTRVSLLRVAFLSTYPTHEASWPSPRLQRLAAMHLGIRSDCPDLHHYPANPPGCKLQRQVRTRIPSSLRAPGQLLRSWKGAGCR